MTIEGPPFRGNSCTAKTDAANQGGPSPRGWGELMLVDEVWKYCSPTAIPQELANCIQTGRIRNLEMMFATQRPNRLNETITNEVTELVCFRLQGVNALKRVADLGAPLEEVVALAPGAFVAVNVDTGGELRGRVF